MIRDNYYNHCPLASMLRNSEITLEHDNDNDGHDDDGRPNN